MLNIASRESQTNELYAVLQQRKSGDWLVTIADILLTIGVKLFRVQTTKL